MPLQKDYESPTTGAVAGYHVVTQVALDFTMPRTTATVSSYLTKAARDSGKQPIYTQGVPLDGLPADKQNALDYAEAQLIVPAPDGPPSGPYPNRYILAGAQIVA